MLNRGRVDRDYNQPIEIADGVFWVGYYDETDGLHCNPYLIVDGDEAVLVDGGNRPDFSTVMMKILQTGINPANISALIYQHYDPDLCGSIPHLEEIIARDDLKIISHRENNIFIKYYDAKSPRLCLETMKGEFVFSGGRKLRFIRTPYAHSPGSFVTFDEATGTLLSSDIFGSYGREWDLFLDLEPACAECGVERPCPIDKKCPLYGLVDFHKRIMTSTKALQYAIEQFHDLPISVVAPQHGSVIPKKEDIKHVMQILTDLPDVGIDGFSE